MWDSLREAIGFKKKNVEEATARDPKKTAIKKLGQAVKDGAGGTGFEDSPIDMSEIQRAYHTDSYIRRAIDKHVGLMFKNGWDFNGKNDKATQYVWTRMKLMSEGTGKSIEELLDQLAFDFILYSNAYLVKARAKGTSSAPGVKAVGYTGKQPVAGYFILPPTTVKVARDDLGNITGYEQDTGGGNSITFKPEDIVHLKYRQPTGRAYGVPMVYNVLDDVKLLRQLEENVARLVYRNLFPLYLYQVGLDKPGFEATDEEIEDIREQIRDMPMDGGIVVPERHNISVIGANGNALDASPYLSYYRQRVFTGLNVSDTVMGIGGTANRSTSDNQAADLFDGVKEYQRSFSTQFQQQVINEILFEGGYDPTLKPEDEVSFFFEEIELDAKIKKENHITQLFTQNVITHDEMRQLIGLDPVTDESRLYFNMVTIPVNMAKPVAPAPTDPNGGGQQQQSANNTSAQGPTDKTPANNAGNNKNQPANQHGKQTSPGKPKASVSEKVDEKLLTEADEVVTLNPELPINNYVEYMSKFWNTLSDDITSRVKRGDSLEHVRAFAIELARQSFRGKNRQYISSAMMKGLTSGREELNKPGRSDLSLTFAIEQVVNESEKYVNRLIDDIVHLVEKALTEDTTMDNRLAEVRGAFNSNKYRLSFIAKSELYRAFNYGRVKAAEEAGLKSITIVPHNDSCTQCIDRQGEQVLTGHNAMDIIPPHHTNCECLVQLNMSAEEV